MFSSKDQENAKKAVSKMGGCKDKQTREEGVAPEDNLFLGLNPSQLLVIAGIIGGGLQVESVLVDRDQEVQIVLSGSLKRKTELDKVMEQIGSLPFSQVFTAMMNNLQ